ncbi:hypothetical protein SAMN05192533_101197 [Mesobacillus persicus]|uniref:Uncharacterized protein n=1 Tax=Mesobacillus persicus TaxID=930146 RepID=A0A1H7VZA6_9BACI|nr:hypothetical protein [Mesobacillus persicus]SEM14576.1 hypothetical protein SAMN05192533_101197 [Mesobacillus persicus]
MAVTLPHIEDSSRTHYIPPVGNYETFTDADHYAEKVKEWGLSAGKEQFWYKDKDHQRLVSIRGYIVYGETDDFNTVIIEFQDGNLSCIHPAYLKEMQSSNFGKAVISNSAAPSSEKPTVPVNVKEPEKKTNTKESKAPKTSKKSAEVKKDKSAKLVLPEEKVHFTAVVRQFALTWNHFNEENDEVVILDKVIIHQDEQIDVGLAWCAHSKTLKKFELAPGEIIEFDGKIVKKKLAKGKDVDEEFIISEPVQYKINNPSKLKKS